MPAKLADKLLEAFFLVGGNRMRSQRGPTRRATPTPVAKYYLDRAHARRQIKTSKRLHWHMEYVSTYYRAPQLPGWIALDFEWSKVIDACHKWAQENEEQVA